MAAPLDRSWYSTLIDDDGSGSVGTVWNKAAVDSLMDAVDASLAGVVDKTGAPAANQIAVFGDGDTIAGSPAHTVRPNGDHILTGANPSLDLVDTSAPVSQQTYRIVNTLQQLYFQARSPTLGDVNPLILGRTVAYLFADLLLQTGHITFPATPIPSADPRTLDDYQEGQWTPRIAGTSGSSGNTYSAQTGLFTKIGRLVVAEFTVALATKGTNPGSLAIDNFPFIAAQGSATCLLQFYGLATNWTTIRAHMQPGAQYALLYGVQVTANTNNLYGLGGADIANGSDLRGVMMYHTP